VREFLTYLDKGDDVIDCGIGPLADYSIEFAKLGYSVTGVDISETTLNYAKKQIDLSGQKIKLIQDDFSEFKNVKGKYDMVFCTGTFGHIPSYLSLEVMKRFNKKTKMNRYALIQFWIDKEPSVSQIIYGIFYDIGFKIKRVFGDVFPVNCSTYTYSEIEDLCGRSGFKIIKTAGGYHFLQKIIELN